MNKKVQQSCYIMYILFKMVNNDMLSNLQQKLLCPCIQWPSGVDK